MNPTIRAIDVGRRSTKYSTGMADGTITCALFPSIAHPHEGDYRNHRTDGEQCTVLVPVERLLYEVGPDIHLRQRPFNAQILQHDRYAEAPEYTALVLGALHYMACPHIDLLVLGLPVASARNPEAVEKLEKRITGRHQVGQNSYVTVGAVKVLAQPAGALMWVGQQQERRQQLLAQKSLVIDPGSRTFDWIYFNGMRQVTQRSHSIALGMFDVLQTIADGIGQTHGIQYRDYEAIDLALRGEQVLTVFQKEYDIRRHVRLAAKIPQQAVAEMLHYVGDASDIQNIILVAGGSFFFQRAVKQAFPRHRVETVAEPIYAIVRGLHLAGAGLAASGKLAMPPREPV